MLIMSAAGRRRLQSLECTECHRDPHEGRFAAGTERGGERGCITCHDSASFTTTRIDADAHAAYGFPLKGAHAAVPCFDCHREMVREPGSTLRLETYLDVKYCGGPYLYWFSGGEVQNSSSVVTEFTPVE